MKTNLFYILLFISIFTLSFSTCCVNKYPEVNLKETIYPQETDSLYQSEGEVDIDDNEVYSRVEYHAHFTTIDGCGLYCWMNQHLIYPQQCKTDSIQGRVFVQFIIEKDGSITEPKILRGKYDLLDAEALRIVEIMPKWTPALIHGRVVRSKFVLPVLFELDN